MSEENVVDIINKKNEINVKKKCVGKDKKVKTC